MNYRVSFFDALLDFFHFFEDRKSIRRVYSGNHRSCEVCWKPTSAVAVLLSVQRPLCEASTVHIMFFVLY